MSLEDWLKNNWLHSHEPSAEEVHALLHSAEEDLRSAEIKGIAAGWRLNMAYAAALRYARAAQYVCGYRPGREHERTIDSLTYTVHMIEPSHSGFTRKWGGCAVAAYASVDLVSGVTADASIKVARELGTDRHGSVSLHVIDKVMDRLDRWTTYYWL